MNANKRIKEIADTARARKERDMNVISFKYNVTLTLTGPDGKVKEERTFHNLIVTAGKQKLLDSTASSKYVKDFSRIAIGTGTTAANAADTTLQTEVARSAAVTPSNPDANTCRFANTFAAGTGTGAITETGLFDANSAGNMLNRLVFAAVNKGAGDALTVTIDIT